MEQKVNVWQVGYATVKDFVLCNRENAVCRPMGYVIVDTNSRSFADEVWNALNWSCWTNKKPNNVFSPLTHCNSDIIIQVDNTKCFKCADPFGWTSKNNLEDAISHVKKSTLWPFADVQCVGGHYKEEDGKVFHKSTANDEWEEVTW